MPSSSFASTSQSCKSFAVRPSPGVGPPFGDLRSQVGVYHRISMRRFLRKVGMARCQRLPLIITTLPAVTRKTFSPLINSKIWWSGWRSSQVY